MKLLPVPQTYDGLCGLFPHWYPFLEKIAQRTREPIKDLLAKVSGHHVQMILIWDEDAGKAAALIGMSYHMRGDELIAEWVWMTGTDRKAWEGLLPELERYLTEHVGCAELRPICRPGWSRILKPHGYRITHYTMAKKLNAGA